MAGLQPAWVTSSMCSCRTTSGVDAISMMRERVADLPVIAISGMTPLDFVSGTPELSNVFCLQKPFRPNDLMHAIEAARAAVPPPALGVA
jgi:FixJ family two-component response regulator